MVVGLSDNANVTSDVDRITNVDEMDFDDHEDNNLSCLENEIVNENNLSNVDSALVLNNYKTFKFLGQERNGF